MEKRNVFFKYEVEFKGNKYRAGTTIELELESYEFDRLTRQGCIYVPKVAEYNQEETEIKQEEPKKKKKKVSKKAKVKNVDHKDSEQAEVQANDSDKE